MEDITLVILAAGMGSRFGGLKQITPMGPSGEFIIDYSIYDAIKAGFTKVVFLIKRENYDEFVSTIGSRVNAHIKVEYCFQENNNLPEGCNVPDTRVKPLGTAHAILCCREKVNEPFAIINSDDFYGRDAFMKAATFLRNMNPSKMEYGMVGYRVANTITENGSVKRGVCEVDDGNLVKITESSVERINGVINASPLNGEPSFDISDDTIVSMNLLLFNPTIFNYIEDKFPIFFKENSSCLDKAEFLIPDVLFDSIKEDLSTVNVLKTNATWYGVTYREDSEFVIDSLKELVKKGEYSNNLWS